ncbi:hypothetical protein HQ865_19115 [Mucilaginibacter mali]|uniref:Uncharacterized protein n=1 Tax=Mucilaginibacter mali TaxID=2740462 RepID=A0A7D4Q2Z7_9SPHI|nr:hypothetical protein [Mucilaginibacter mali]QKJ31786.1 hypothetical protein HQ865_19115 [Mucilaginibacter mali]
MHKTLLFLFAASLFTINTRAQTNTDTVLKKSPVRTLTDQQYNAYLKGADVGNKAYIAELYHYPLPDKLLQYKKELDLSPSQIAAITAIVKQLQMKRLEIGASVIRNERVLDSLFRTNKADEGSIIFFGNRYGLYEGEYRTAVLTACFKTQKALTDRQIKKFEALLKHN